MRNTQQYAMTYISNFDILARVQVDGEVDELGVLGHEVAENVLLEHIPSLLLEMQGNQSATAQLVVIAAGVLCVCVCVRVSMGVCVVCGELLAGTSTRERNMSETAARQRSKAKVGQHCALLFQHHASDTACVYIYLHVCVRVCVCLVSMCI